ncbi:MAG: hypothetical protein DWQ04_06535 [Chloroflexi bacterium]|nr:MAG: hypothetical protein DWQ04_06535 [Chloroflexota bacterium]
MAGNKDFTQLRKLLIHHFNIAELRVLCFDLGVDYEELEGTTKTTKMQDLILYLERRGELPLLIDAVREARPGVNWPDLSEESKLDKTSETMPAGDSYTNQKTGLEMIRIPAGEYLYSDENRVDYLPEYWISKTPVTNRHYVRFVRATNEKTPEHWKGKSPPGDIADHPVVYVSFDDAAAYAKWAGMQMPTEQEWEKAARGTDGRKYPWGNDWQENHCNTYESGILGKTPVSQFSPQGNSPYGLEDMSGNVWERTDSWYYDDKEFRVIRGGSWTSNADEARAAYRYRTRPSDRDHNGGFRLVVRRPLSQEGV